MTAPGGTAAGAGAGSGPERIGRYRVREVTGAGAFATVYRALDERLDAEVALKVLADNHSLDPDVRDRFLHEGRLLRRARSPHLVTVHDLGETDRAQPYLVLEWADRGDLAARRAAWDRDGRAATPADGLALARALAGALGALHAIRVVHRDLTPRNLLLRADPGPGTPEGRGTGAAGPLGHGERLLVADLGLSKDLARASGLTVATGTSGFAAPEQRGPGGPVDHRADLWAASALVAWLATGQAPDDEGRWRELVMAAGWPRAVVPALARGLAAAPEDRHRGVDEWLAALEDALGAPAPGPGGGAGRPAAGAPAAPGPRGGTGPGGGGAGAGPRPRGARHGARAVAAVAALLVAAAAGHALAGGGAGDGPEVTTQALAGGRERTVAEGHGITITLEGPAEVPVGGSAELSATVDGAASWAWVGPDGSMHPAAARLDVVPAGPGRLTVRLVAADDRGRLVEAEHRARAVEE